LLNRAFTALHVATNHNDLNAGLRQLVGQRSADAARGSGDKGCPRHLRLLVSFASTAGGIVGLRKDDIGPCKQ
jgi:hypothetical protein